METVTDESSLVARALDGDQAAWERIVRLHWRHVGALSWAIVQDPMVAEDVAQDTFVNVRRRLVQYRGEGALGAWIHTICRNLALEEVRRRRRRARDVSFDGPNPQAWENGVCSRVAGTRNDDEDHLVLRLDLETGLRRLPRDEREAFVLIKRMGYSSDEAAELTGVAPSTVRSRLARARGRLAAMLADREGEVENGYPVAAD